MRTTVNIDDQLLRDAKQSAVRTGRTLSEVVSDALRLALRRRGPPSERPFVLPTYSPPSGMEGVQPGVDLDCTSALLDLMDEWDADHRR